MAVSPQTRSTLTEISALLSENRIQDADSKTRELISRLSSSELTLASSDIEAQIARFMNQRRRELGLLLKSRHDRLASGATSSESEVVVRRPLSLLDTGEPLSLRIRHQLHHLAFNFIFKWAPNYRDVLKLTLSRSIEELPPTGALEIQVADIGEEFASHSIDIFQRGYIYQTSRGLSRDVAEIKSISGVQSFLDLLVSLYLETRPKIENAAQANALWGVTSAAIGGVLRGYGRAEFGEVPGWSLLQKHPASWLPPIGFCRGTELMALFEEFPDTLSETNLQLVLGAAALAIERMAHSFHGRETLLPRLSRMSINRPERLDVTYSAKRGALNQDLLVSCFWRGVIEGPAAIRTAQGVRAAVIVARLGPENQAWVESESIAGVIDASGFRAEQQQIHHLSELVLSRLEAVSLSGEADHDPAAISHNFASDFPLDDPDFRRQFLIERHSVKKLLQDFEGNTGIHLWCSVRRSGKTTAAQELAGVGGASLVVSQTMDRQPRQPIQNIFSRRIRDAFETGRDLSDDFFIDVVRECTLATTASDASDARIVFIIDEYESLFGLIDSNVRDDKGLKYKVALPLLSQMVDFATRHLLIFMGQRPDAFLILAADSQLAPLVKQKSFPLFEHRQNAPSTEFTQLLSRVLSDKLPFDSPFANAVFIETGGHPYLTVNLMEDFNDWLIENKYRMGVLSLSAENFTNFEKDRLGQAALKRSSFYSFFSGQMSQYLSEAARADEPWLSAVALTLKAIANKHPKTFTCSISSFETLVAPIASDARQPLGRLLTTATQANFLKDKDGQVSPGIRILARLAASAAMVIN